MNAIIGTKSLSKEAVMYTIVQVAHFLGMTRDTLKFYEEKGLVKSQVDQENGYRKYNEIDIFNIMITNFYRAIDLEIKHIQKIKNGESVENIMLTLEQKEQEILDEIAYKQRLLKQIAKMKENCEKVKQYLDKHIIREMQPLEVKGELTHVNAYEEYNLLQEYATGLKKAVTLTDLRRIVYFDATGIVENRFVVVNAIEEREEKDKQGEVFSYPKCIYTIIEDGRWLHGEKNIDNKVGDTLSKIGLKHGYKPFGIVFANILLTTYASGLERSFLEIYAPIE